MIRNHSDEEPKSYEKFKQTTLKLINEDKLSELNKGKK